MARCHSVSLVGVSFHGEKLACRARLDGLSVPPTGEIAGARQQSLGSKRVVVSAGIRGGVVVDARGIVLHASPSDYGFVENP
jgi:hypothetical protein